MLDPFCIQNHQHSENHFPLMFQGLRTCYSPFPVVMAAAIFFVIFTFLQPIIEISPDKPFTTHTSSNLEDPHSPKHLRLLPYGEAVKVNKGIIYAFESLVEVFFVVWVPSVKANVWERSEFGTASV